MRDDEGIANDLEKIASAAVQGIRQDGLRATAESVQRALRLRELADAVRKDQPQSRKAAFGLLGVLLVAIAACGVLVFTHVSQTPVTMSVRARSLTIKPSAPVQALGGDAFRTIQASGMERLEIGATADAEGRVLSIAKTEISCSDTSAGGALRADPVIATEQILIGADDGGATLSLNTTEHLVVSSSTRIAIDTGGQSKLYRDARESTVTLEIVPQKATTLVARVTPRGPGELRLVEPSAFEELLPSDSYAIDEPGIQRALGGILRGTIALPEAGRTVELETGASLRWESFSGRVSRIAFVDSAIEFRATGEISGLVLGGTLADDDLMPTVWQYWSSNSELTAFYAAAAAVVGVVIALFNWAKTLFGAK